MLVGLLVIAALKRVAAEQKLRDAMRRLDVDEFMRERDGAVPTCRRRFKQEGLLEDHLIGRVLGERPRIEVRSGRRVVVTTGHTSGEIIAKQSAGVGVVRDR